MRRYAARQFWVVFLGIACTAARAQTPAIPTVRETDAVCQRCHDAIYRGYLETTMANASGRAQDKFISGSFRDVAGDASYAISLIGGIPTLTERGGGSANPASQQLRYYLGSGHLGVTYMYSQNGYLLESPIAFYTALGTYDLKPGLGQLTGFAPALPMSPQCMGCHMSRVQTADTGSINHYPGLPFLDGGITCEACHGDAQAHISSGGKAAVLNPAKLSPERRDSICIRCHLEGDTSVEHAGRSLASYRPGDRIEDYVSYFVYRNANLASRGVSEVEELDASHCKQSSGAAMSCMSCHDPHRQIAASDRTEYYRAKCLQCHTGAEFSAAHYPQQRDCTACHMPTGKAENIPHVAWTDHRILIRPAKEPATTESGPADLVSAIPGDTPGNRELALGYANLVISGKQAETQRAWHLLVDELSASPKDPAILVDLGYLAQQMGAASQAIALYQQALAQDPANLSANTNLGILLARSGKLDAAIPLLQRAFTANEDMESLGLNLAIADCRNGDRAAAFEVLSRVLLYNPGSAGARERRLQIENGALNCTLVR